MESAWKGAGAAFVVAVLSVAIEKLACGVAL